MGKRHLPVGVLEERVVQLLMSDSLVRKPRTRRAPALADEDPVTRKKAPIWVRLAVCRTADELMAQGTFSVKARLMFLAGCVSSRIGM